MTADASFDVISYHRELRTVGKVLKLHAHVQEILLQLKNNMSVLKVSP